MNAARRDHKKRDWPRGLYESKPGYFVWRSLAGKTLALGRVPLRDARAEAIAANAYEADAKPSLVDRLAGGTNTIADLLDKMKAAKTVNTGRAWKSLDKIIRMALGPTECGSLTVAQCAELIEGIVASGKQRSAEAVRARLVQVCRRGQRLGWMPTNPAEVTESPDVDVKRGRLTLATFHAIYDAAPNVADWLQRAMMIGLVLGADRVTIARLTRSNVADGLLTYRRSKTKTWIAVPLGLRLDAVGVSLDDLVSQRSTVLSPYLLHHMHAQGKAKIGAPVHPDTISQAFTDARMLAKIPDEAAPTFHELRSLCKREYEKQGGVDTKALLGHAGIRTAELYADPRGIEAVKVRIGA